MDEKLASTLWNIQQRNVGEPEFIQAVKEVPGSIGVVLVRIEMGQLNSRHSTYLTSGPILNSEVTHAKDCLCESNPRFQDALACALTSDRLLDGLLRRLEGCSAAPSVLHLAKRLRDLEETKDIQIAKFTRMD